MDDDAKKAKFDAMDKASVALANAIVAAIADHLKKPAQDFTNDEQQIILAALACALCDGGVAFGCPPEIFLRLVMKFFGAKYDANVKMVDAAPRGGDPRDLDSYDWENAPRC